MRIKDLMVVKSESLRPRRRVPLLHEAGRWVVRSGLLSGRGDVLYERRDELYVRRSVLWDR